MLLLLLLRTTSGSAQFQHKLFSSNLLFEGRAHYGFIYAQHLEMELFNAHFPSFEFTIQQITYGKHQWERDYSYPMVGATAYFSTLGNSPYLGKAYALMPFINFPLYRQGRFTAGFRLALGLGYLTKHFDRISNYKNLAIGSSFNAAVNLMLDARWQINYYLGISAGISLQHFSNGSLKLPNYGLNIPELSLGVSLRPFKANSNIDDRFYAPTEPYEAEVYKNMEFNIGGLAGYKNMQAVYGRNYVVLHLYENTFFRISRIMKGGFGLDFSYDPSQITTLERSGDTVSNKLVIVRPGLNGAFAMVLSKTDMVFNLGYYLGGKEQSNGPFYEKFTFQYHFTRDLFAAVMLKVHWGRADYIGWGLGYKFNMKYGRRTIR